MTQPKQREREVQIVRSFLDALDLKPLEVMEGPDPPDVLVRLPEMSVAIEVTEYHSSQKRRQAEEAWTDLILASRPIREQHPDVNSLSVHLELKKQRLPKTAEFGSFIKEVVKLCQDHVDRVSDEDFYVRDGLGSYPTLARVTNYVILRDVGGYIDWHCSLDSAYVGLTEEELLNTVRKKARAKMPQGTDQYWLVISGGWLISQQTGLLWEEELQDFNQVNDTLAVSAFDAVYLCDSQIARWSPEIGWKIVRE